MSKELLLSAKIGQLHALVSGAKHTIVLDSGAGGGSFTSDRSHFTGTITACNAKVSGLDPDGKMVAIGVGEGKVSIRGVFVPLRKLYYVPGMRCTLVSLSCLAEDGWTSTIAVTNGVNAVTLKRDGMNCVVPMSDGLYQCPAETDNNPQTMWEENFELEPLTGVLCGFVAGVSGEPAGPFLELGKEKCELEPMTDVLCGLIPAGGGEPSELCGWLVQKQSNVRSDTRSGNTYTGGMDATELLHRRLGHVSWGNAKLARRLRKEYGATVGKGHNMRACEACMRAKMMRQISKNQPTRRATRALERIHFDLSPSIPTRGVGDYAGFLLLVDEYTGRKFVCLIRSKSEVAGLLQDFKIWAETHFREAWGEIILLAGMRSDNESVNVCSTVRKWARHHGIAHEKSVAYEQWQNGIAERNIRTVWEGAEAMRKDAGAPDSFWPYSVLAFVHVSNRLALGDGERSPYEKWWDVDIPMGQRLGHLRIWGSKCYAHVPKELRKKLGDKARVCVLLGYAVDKKAYRLMELSTGATFDAISVAFDETRLPLQEASNIPQENARPGTGLQKFSLPSANPQPLAQDVAAVHPPTHLEQRHDLSNLAELSPGSEPFDLPPTELDDHEYKAEEPGLPDLEHSFVDGSASPELYEVNYINGYQLHNTEDEEGATNPYVTQMYRCHWVNGQVTWVPRSCLDMSRDALRHYEGQKNSKRHIKELRGKFKGKVLGYDYSPNQPVPAAAAAGAPKELGDQPSPIDEPALDEDVELLDVELLEPVGKRSKAKNANNMDVKPENILPAGSRRSLQALRATLAEVQVQQPEEFGCDLNGAVYVPRVDPLALQKFELAAKLDGPTMSNETLLQVEERIRLLALVASDADRAAGAKPVPRSFREAMKSVHAAAWMQAMEREMGSMEEFGVWKLVQLPPGKNVMSCKWVYDIKRDVKGEVLKLKARLTARGFTQKEGRDFDATWAPTCRMRVFRMMMAEASSDPSIQTAQWDLSTAFLHARMKSPEGVYMQQAPGFVLSEGGEAKLVCHLLKAIYGCKQSSRLFHELIRESLKEMGAVQAKADECLFTFRDGNSWLKVLVHVDDFACTFNDRSLYNRIFKEMQSRFKITDYGGGPITRFVGICVEKTSAGYYRLHQKQYIEQVLDRLGITDIKHALSPERAGTEARLTPYEGELSGAERDFMEAVPYKEAVGALFYLARSTRFDIAHACGQVARFMDRPCARHWRAVLRIYGYLARTKDVALVMKSRGMQCELGDQFLEGLADADWAGCGETRKSHTGWIVRVGGSLVSWYSKRQGSISQSTAEAEYVAAAAVANEVIWWRRLCADMAYDFGGPVTVWCDNRAATNLADHEGRFDAVKHIQLRYHVLRDYQKRGLVKVCWRTSAKMWADVLTKNCQPKHFRSIVTKLLGEQV